MCTRVFSELIAAGHSYLKTWPIICWILREHGLVPRTWNILPPLLSRPISHQSSASAGLLSYRQSKDKNSYKHVMRNAKSANVSTNQTPFTGNWWNYPSLRNIMNGKHTNEIYSSIICEISVPPAYYEKLLLQVIDSQVIRKCNSIDPYRQWLTYATDLEQRVITN